MGPDPTVIGLFKYKGKRISESLMRSQPHKFVRASLYSAFKNVEVTVANFRVETIAGNNQISVAKFPVNVVEAKLLLKL